MKNKGTKQLTLQEEARIIGDLIAEVEAKNARATVAGVRLSDQYEPVGTFYGAATCDLPGCVMCDVEEGRR